MGSKFSSLEAAMRMIGRSHTQLWAPKMKAGERHASQAARLHHMASASVALGHAQRAVDDFREAFVCRASADAIAHTTRLSAFAGAGLGSLLALPLDALFGTSRRALAAPMTANEPSVWGHGLNHARRALDIGLLGAAGLLFSFAASAAGAALGAIVGAAGAGLFGSYQRLGAKRQKSSLIASMQDGATLGAILGGTLGTPVAYLARLGVELARVGTGIAKSAAMAAGGAAGALLGAAAGVPVGLAVLAAVGVDSLLDRQGRMLHKRQAAPAKLPTPLWPPSEAAPTPTHIISAESFVLAKVPASESSSSVTTPSSEESASGKELFRPRMTRRLSRVRARELAGKRPLSMEELLRELLDEDFKEPSSRVASFSPVSLTQPL